MPKLKNRLGGGKWTISHKGKTITRKVSRKVVNGKVVPFARIKGKHVRLKR